MTGGGFYVVSFVSCSSCFMLKFSGHYVIKLFRVWRAQAPPFSPFSALALLAQGGPGHRHLEQPAVVLGGQAWLYLLFLRGSLSLRSKGGRSGVEDSFRQGTQWSLNIPKHLEKEDLQDGAEVTQGSVVPGSVLCIRIGRGTGSC